MQISIPVELKPIKNGANELFKLSKLNGNFSSMYNNGILVPNVDIDDSIFYWLVNSKSALQSWCYWTTANNVRTVVNGEGGEHSSPIILQCSANRSNKSTQAEPCETAYNEVSDNWNSTNTQAETTSGIPSNFQLNFTSTTCFSVTGNTPLIYKNNSVQENLTTSLGHFSNLANIYDFNYNGILLEIMVAYNNQNNTTISYATLANYIANYNTADNYICGIRYNICFGNETQRYESADTAANGSYFITANYKPIPYIHTRMKTPTEAAGAASYTDAEFLRCSPFTPNSYSANGISLVDYSDTLSQASGTKPHITSDMWEIVQRQPSTVQIDFIRLKKSGEGIYTDDDFNKIRREVAYLGFWFSDGTYNNGTFLTTPIGENATDDVYMSEIKNGTTTGNFIKGSIAKDTEQAAAGADWRDKIGYNGKDTKNQDRGNLNTVLQRGSITAGCKWYGLNATQLNALVTWINTGYQPASNDQFINDFKGVNPAEYITSVTYMPCYPIPTGTDEMINIGPLSTSVTGRKISYEYGVLIDVGSYPLSREYNDFRDYKPYTAVSLYVPYCGTIELNPANYYGRTINVKLMVDMSTGTCTGLIFANDMLIDSIQGQCGISIPLAAFNMGEYQNAIVNAQYQLKQAQRSEDAAMIGLGISMIGGTLTATTGIGLAAGIAGSIYSYYKLTAARDNIENIEYNIEHMQPKQSNISSGSPTNSQGFERDCRLIITRPNDLETDISIYGHTVGYMTNKQGTLADFHGFTQCSNADLSGIPLTSSEISAIHEALKKGVYLP
ncbi:MAG: hypothetical protein J6R32_08585 [Bacteroidales bacterium]|nr:hypothetical protein [Bacteroidales bacterium]